VRVRPHVTVTTAGHVDHGKSTLVRALTGQDPDRLAEERRRGLTIELGFVWCELPPTPRTPSPLVVAFVDVPGHERFVATAMAGVGPASGTVLVVAADDGWSAQTEEHAELLHLLDRPVVLTVVSKVATVEPERVAAVVAEVERNLDRLGLAGGPVVAVDALSGAGLDELRTRLRDALAALPAAADTGTPRLWVDRAFTRPGAGTVVTGTLAGGALRVGDEVALAPAGPRARLRGLASLGAAVDVAQPGERVACNLAGVSLDAVARGDAVVVDGDVWRSASTVDGWLTPVPDAPSVERGAWQVHVGTARVAARVVAFPGRRDLTGRPGAVRLVLERPLPLRAGDLVVLREDGRRRTVARVEVVDTQPDRLPRGRAAREDRADLVRSYSDAPSDGARWLCLVRLAGGVRDRRELVAITGRSPGPRPPTGLVGVGDRLVLEELVAAARAAASSLGPGVHTRGRVVAQLRDAGLDDTTGDALVGVLVDAGALVVQDGGFVAPEHLEVEVDERAQRRAEVLEALSADGLAPRPLDAVLGATGADGRDVAALVQAGALVRLGSLALARSTIDAAVASLRGSDLAGRPFSAAEARDALGSSRRVVIPLLEHLARTGVTSFDGTHHELRR
jgi:selenocysteine-specific elongation factor